MGVLIVLLTLYIDCHVRWTHNDHLLPPLLPFTWLPLWLCVHLWPVWDRASEGCVWEECKTVHPSLWQCHLMSSCLILYASLILYAKSCHVLGTMQYCFCVKCNSPFVRLLYKGKRSLYVTVTYTLPLSVNTLLPLVNTLLPLDWYLVHHQLKINTFRLPWSLDLDKWDFSSKKICTWKGLKPHTVQLRTK